MNKEHSPPSITHRLVSGNQSMSLPKHANETTIATMVDHDILNTDFYGGWDNHLRSYDQITMTDQSMVGEDPYIAIILDEDSRVNLSPQSRPTIEPMDLDVLPPIDIDLEVLNTPVDRNMGTRDPGSTNQVEVSFQTPDEAPLHQEDLQIEVPCDPVHDYERGSTLNFGNTNSVLGKTHKHSVAAMNKEHSPPSITHRLVSGNESLSLPKHANETTIATMDDLDILNTGISMGQSLPDLKMQPTPPAERQKRNPRKRMLFFDEALVISNVEMKKQLDDATRLVCKRRKLPCSLLDVWRYQNIRKNEGILHAPLLSGMSTNLKEVFDRSYPLSRVDSAPFEHSMGNTYVQTDSEMPDRNLEAEQPDRVMESDQPIRDMVYEQPTRDMEPEQSYGDMELEQPRIDTNADGNIRGKDAFPSDREESPPSHLPNLGLSPEKENTFEIVEPTLEPLSVKLVGNESETPLIHLDMQQYPDTRGLESTGFPSLLNSVDAEDLNFLEASNTSSGSEISEHDNMSARARAVAQYFKEYSPGTGTGTYFKEYLPGTGTSVNRSGILSLNGVLEGKTRKQCARMFFETLVLKNNGFIDVNQEEPYGDIKIYPTPKLAKFN